MVRASHAAFLAYVPCGLGVLFQHPAKIQTEVLRLLAAQRDPESYVAGATPLNRDAARYSGDIDIFHDREERVASAAINDVKALEARGYGVRWQALECTSPPPGMLKYPL